MVEYIVQSAFQIHCRALSRRKRYAVQQYFRVRIMPQIRRHHQVVPVRRKNEIRRRAAIRVRIRPSRQRARHRLHLRLRICRDRIAIAVGLQRPIFIQKIRPYGEQLHQLTPVVLVHNLSRIRRRTVQHVQVVAHVRRERHVLHNLPVIRECILHEEVGIWRDHVAVVGWRHPDLAERQRHSLPQLVVSCKRVVEPVRAHTRCRDRLRRALRRRRGWQRRQIRRRSRELLVQIALQSHLLHMLNGRLGRPKARLVQ